MSTGVSVMNARRESGYTLVELLVAVFLAGLVTAAAFHIHFAFQGSLHRQESVTRMQQTMKVVRSVLVRHMRAAGSGVHGVVWSDCGGMHKVGAYMFHNSNTFGVEDNSEGSNDDTDPDWFEVLSADYNSGSRMTGRMPTMSVIKGVEDSSKFRPGDLIGIQTGKGMCLHVVTSTQPSAGNLQHRPGSFPIAPHSSCYNSPNMRDNCRNLIGQFQEAGSMITNFGTRSAAFRIDESDPKRPILMMSTGQVGGDPNIYPWQPIAEGVEDLQVALHVDNSDPRDELGDYWVSSRDLRVDELAKVRAVRISLVFRSTSEVPGWTQGLRPGLEDRPAATVRDGYVRRVISTVIKLRNMPKEPEE